MDVDSKNAPLAQEPHARVPLDRGHHLELHNVYPVQPQQGKARWTALALGQRASSAYKFAANLTTNLTRMDDADNINLVYAGHYGFNSSVSGQRDDSCSYDDKLPSIRFGFKSMSFVEILSEHGIPDGGGIG